MASAYSVCGSETVHERRRPASRARRWRRATAASHLGVHAVDEVLPRHADFAARARRRRARRGSPAPARAREVESRGSWPAMRCSSAARVRARCAPWGPTWSSDEREGDHAVARHAAVGRLEAHDAGRAPPAGGWSRRCRCPARRTPRARPPPPPSRPRSRRARASGPTGCGWGRRPSSRWTSPSRTRPCSACRGWAAPPPCSSSTTVPS